VTVEDRSELAAFVSKAGAFSSLVPNGNKASDAGYWATPGGAVEEGASFAATAVRELREETGLEAAAAGPQVGRRQFALTLPSGERVMADERFFLVRTSSNAISKKRWTAIERVSMVAHRWWSLDELAQTTETVFPEDLLELVRGAAALQAPLQSER